MVPWGRIQMGGNTTLQLGVGSAEVQIALTGATNLSGGDNSISPDGANNRLKVYAPGNYMVFVELDLTASYGYCNVIVACRKNSLDVLNFFRNVTLQDRGSTLVAFNGLVQASDVTDRVNTADPGLAYIDVGIKTGNTDAGDALTTPVDITVGRASIHVLRMDN